MNKYEFQLLHTKKTPVKNLFSFFSAAKNI